MTKELEGLKEDPKAEIHIDLLRTTLEKISNWKTSGHDGILEFWFKKFTSIPDRLALKMNKRLQGAHVPELMTKGKITLIQKDPLKETAPNNHGPITCLLIMGKILTVQTGEKIYYSLTSRRLFPEEQKGCRKRSRDIGELLYIDQYILNESKTRQKNLAMVWIGYKKSYDMAPKSWIINCLKIYKILDEVINFIEKTMKTWKVKLTAGGEAWLKRRSKKVYFKGMHYHRYYL